MRTWGSVLVAAMALFPGVSSAQQNMVMDGGGGGGGSSGPQTLGGVAAQISSQFAAMGQLLVGAAFLIGVGLLAAGLLKFKQYSDTQGQQVKLGDAVWRVAVGVGLVSLLHFTGVGAATFGFETDAGMHGLKSGLPR